MQEKDPTLITRLGERDGTLRVEAHTYGIDVRIFDTNYGLTVDQAMTLRDRLTECLIDLEKHDQVDCPHSHIVPMTFNQDMCGDCGYVFDVDYHPNLDT